MSSKQKQKEKGGFGNFMVFCMIIFFSLKIISGDGQPSPNQPKTAFAQEIVPTSIAVKNIPKPTKTFNRVILVAGHGGKDVGACPKKTNCENRQTKFITQLTAQKLQKNGVDVLVAPEEIVANQDGVDGLYSKTNWLNKKNLDGLDLILEIHRDSAPGLSFEDASHRCGVFFQEKSQEGKETGSYIRDRLIDYGCNQNSWARPGNWAHIIRESPVSANSFIIELGFVQGDDSPEHLHLMSERLSNTILNITK